ncbi:malectin domain-containing carbohydrate-binding protein [Hymenobacter sp. GOD-10R]|uniref:malectin domain-containing carbohydrate-binding protein n=1 Tax=Hymenobacter sp. GOD-10R TaxID=3093922 RepID=UPI002D771B24|nr:malectin domain-containing carbohydrate-binding protein [Hymenobacter sp. GOD-10R]WRQ29131.1 malectin domain-containing carbohydrate-binding protein [Hymenobacter sp. GOD-10R]
MTIPLHSLLTRRRHLVLLASLLGLSLRTQAQLTITSTSPVRNTNQAPRATNVSLTYNQALNTTTASQVRVFSQQAGGRKAATYSASGNTLTVNPTTDFKPGETVFVTAPATVRSSTGTAATPRVFQFTTQAGIAAGTFGGGSQLAVSSLPNTVTPADVDGDGDLDLLVSAGNFGPTFVNVRLNQGGAQGGTPGTYAGGSDVAVGSRTRGVVVGDIDGDGDLDLLTANYIPTGTVSVRLNQGGVQGGTPGTYGGGSDPTVGSFPQSVALGDVDGDGDLDLLAANSNDVTVSVRLNNGQGAFSGGSEVSVGSGPRDLALGDVDSDGDLDLLTINDGDISNFFSASVSVRLNNGGGGFGGGSNWSLNGGARGIALGDLDQDGALDLLVATSNSVVNVFRNNGQGRFTSGQEVRVGTDTNDLALGDVDGDGNLDFLTANYNGNSVSVRLNTGQGTFSGGTEVPLGPAIYSVSVGDLDGDGDLDLAASSFSENTVSVRLNQAPSLPTITSFTPTRGVAGTSVTITGTGFTGGTVVRFNSTTASGVTVTSATQLTATVPASATSGPISVTTPGGTASTSGLTPAVFTVTAAPVVTTTDGTTTALEQTFTAVDPGLTVTDADGSTLASATVSISSGFVSSQDELLTTPTGNITTSYNPTTGVLTLTSSAARVSLAQWQTVLRNVSYRNSSATPNTAPRTVRFVVNDGELSSSPATKLVQVQAVNSAPSVPIDSDPALNTVAENAPAGTLVGLTAASSDADGTVSYSLPNSAGGRFAINPSTGVVTVANGTLLDYEAATSHTVTVQASDGTLTSAASFTIQVTNVNEAPVVTTTAGPTTFTEGAGAVVVDNGVTVTDVDSPTLTSATVSFTAGQQAGQDVLAFTNTSAATFGTIGSATTTGTLTLTASGGPATLAQWQAALRAVTFANTSATPTTAPRTVSFVVNDGTLSSSAATKVVQVQAVNGAPSVPTDSNPAPNTVAENAAPGTLVGLTASSIDLDGTVTYSLTSSAGGRFAINATTGVVTVANGSLLDYETATAHSILVQASDGTLTSSASFTIQVTNVNEPPVVANQSFSIPASSPAGTVVGTVVATDPDAGQTLIYSITAGNPASTFIFVGNQLQVANAAALSTTGTYALTVQVQDNGSPSLVSTATVTVTVTPVTQVLYRLNAGGPALNTSLGPFAADQYFSTSRTGANTGPIAGTTDDALYQTERFEGAFGYALRVPNGTYQVVLHFAELYWTQPGQRIFDVRAENQLVLDNYDILRKVTPFTATMETFSVVVTDGVLNLDLSALAQDGGRDAAKLSALEVLALSSGPNQAPVIANQSFSVAEGSVAGTLVGTVVASDPDAGQTLSYALVAGNTDGAFAFVGNQLQVANATAVRTAASPFTLTVRVTDDGNPALSATATLIVTVTPGMQVFYRLNAGGPAVNTSFGAFAADQFFSTSRTGANSSPIAGTTDDALYQTERFEGAFGYSLRIPNGTYQVVLHFAETYWTQPGQRVFDVRAENQLVLDNYDILKKVVPFTATTETFTVVVTDGVLNLDLSALESEGGRDAAKLSALEVRTPAAAQSRTTLAGQAVLAAKRKGPLNARLEAVPNPFAEQVNLRFQLPQAEAYTLTVYDLAGRALRQQSGQPVAAGERQQVSLELGRYPVGVYVVRLTTASGTQQVRVVKQ